MEEHFENDELSLKELILITKEWFSYLVSQWKLLLLIGLLGGALGWLYAITKKPVYTASVSFVVDSDKSSAGIGSAIASQFGFDLGSGGGGVFSDYNLIELYKSRSMVSEALLEPVATLKDSRTLIEDYINIKNYKKEWKKEKELQDLSFPVGLKSKDFSRLQDSIMSLVYENLLRSNLSVGQRDKKNDIINIDVKFEDEQFAKNFTESLVRVVSNFYIETKSKKAAENLAILTKQTDSVRRALNNAITGVAVAEDNTFGLNPALNVRRAPSVKRQVDVEANSGILGELVKQTELAKVTLRKETPLIQVIDKPVLPLPEEKVGRLKGIVLGGIIATFFAILFLLSKRYIQQVLHS